MDNQEVIFDGPTPRSRISWWFRWTAPRGVLNYAVAPTHRERERLRRAGLTSIIAPFVFFAPLLLLQQANEKTIGISILLMLMTIIALFFNKGGKQELAAIFL